jgi:hypothetical protein
VLQLWGEIFKEDIGGMHGVMLGEEGWGHWQSGAHPTVPDSPVASLAESRSREWVAMPLQKFPCYGGTFHLCQKEKKKHMSRTVWPALLLAIFLKFSLKRSHKYCKTNNKYCSSWYASGLVPALFQKEKKKRKEKSIVRLDKDYESAAQIVNILRQLACPDDSPLKVPTSLLRMTHQS